MDLEELKIKMHSLEELSLSTLESMKKAAIRFIEDILDEEAEYPWRKKSMSKLQKLLPRSQFLTNLSER